MYVVEGTTYHSFKELTREYNRRQCTNGGENYTKSFVDAYKKCRDEEKAKKGQ